MKKYSLRVTIGICAYNEEGNIGKLLGDLRRQKYRRVRLEKVVVVTDGSKDNTAEEVRQMDWRLLGLVEGRVNKGKSWRVNQVCKMCESDVLVLLDADVRIQDEWFVERMCAPILDDEAELVSCLMVPGRSRNGFERALRMGERLKLRLFKVFKDGANAYLCHGPARALARKLYKQRRKADKIGDDLNSYLVCRRLGMRFGYIETTEIYFQLPSCWQDYARQSRRFEMMKKELKNKFGELLVREVSIPVGCYIRAGAGMVKEGLKDPVFAVYYLLLWVRMNWVRRLNFKVREKAWDLRSTKQVVGFNKETSFI